MTFKELQDDTLDKLGFDNTTASSTPRTQIKRFLNQWHRRISSDSKYTRMRYTKGVLVTVASQILYGMPPAFEVMGNPYDATTGNPPLVKKSPEWLRQDTQADISEGTPWAYVDHGLKPIFRFPASTGIWAVSSAAGDTTQAIRMDAIRTSGYGHQAGPTTLTGTTRVQVGTRSDYIDITKIFLSAVCVGDVSLYDAAAAGNLLGVIPIGKLYSRYHLLQFYPVPSSAITYTIEGKCKLWDLVQDVDEPLWPEDYHWLLGTCAYYQGLRDLRKQLPQASILLKDEIQPELSNMLDFLVNSPDYVIVPEDLRANPWTMGSNLGSWYPKGRW